MMKKKLAALTLSIAMAFSLVACGGAGSSSAAATSGSTAGSQASSAEPVTVTVWHMFPEDAEETLNHQRLLKWAEDFNATNTDNITVEVSGAKTADVIMTTIASGSTPDIFQNYWNNAPTWADNGALYDMTEFVNSDTEWDKDDFLDSAWNLCTYEGKVYSIPMTVSTTFMAYRPDILAECGWDHFPTTMEELAQCIRDCTQVEADGTITRMGMIPDYPWLDTVLWPAAFGAHWTDGDAPDFDNPEQIAAYQFQRDIYDEYGYDNVRRFIDTLGARATAEDPLFTGKLAMRWSADSGLAQMEEHGKDVDWAIAPLPYPEGVEGGQMLTAGVWEMNAKTENPEATWKVMASLTSAETQAFLAEGDYNNGQFMPRASALNHLINDLDVSDAAKQNAQSLLDEELINFPVTSYTSEYLNIITAEMSLALTGETSVEDAAASVQQQVEELANG